MVGKRKIDEEALQPFVALKTNIKFLKSQEEVCLERGFVKW